MEKAMKKLGLDNQPLE